MTQEEKAFGTYLKQFYPFITGLTIQKATDNVNYLCPRISYAKLVKEFPDIEFASYKEISYEGVSKYYYLSSLVSPTSENDEYATKLFSDIKQDIYGHLMFFITSGLYPFDRSNNRYFMEQFIIDP
jgi:hypothetical protein